VWQLKKRLGIQKSILNDQSNSRDAGIYPGLTRKAALISTLSPQKRKA